MEVYTLPAQQAQLHTHPRCVALGVFDGLHAGHRHVILAANKGMPDGVARTVYTFQTGTVTTKEEQRRLCTIAEQRELLSAMGVDELLEVDFSAIRELSPEAFVEEILHRQLGAVQVACGYNYRFGKNGAGDASTLTTLCKKRGIAVRVVEPVRIDGQTACSSTIREALSAGDMNTARRLQSRPYCLRLPVTEGQHLGHRLGMPTINQQLPSDLFPPRYGVYASCVETEEQVLPAVTNIGVRPTVGAESPLAETWIQGFDGDLYGATPSVYPLVFLRGEQKFDSLEALHQQVERDAAAARELFTPPAQTEIRAILFDFDSTLRGGPSFYNGVTAWVTYYFPTLSAEEIAARREEIFRYHDYLCGTGTDFTYETLVQHFLEEWDCDADLAVATRRFYDGFSDGCPLYEDAIPTLAELRRRGYRLGIITNGFSYPQNRKLDSMNLRPYVDVAMVSCDEGVHKPAPLIFYRGAARLGVPVECCAFVGDSPSADVQGAINAGMLPIQKVESNTSDERIHAISETGIPVIRQIVELLDLFSEIQ